MAKKTYRTYYLRGYAIHTKDELGRPVDVVFRGGIQIDSTAKFTTGDENIQKVLEGLKAFGRTFYLESVVEDKPKAAPAPKEEKPKEEPMTDVKDIRRFKNLVEMKNAMTEAGIKVEDSWNYAVCKAEARKEGYDFQIKR